MKTFALTLFVGTVVYGQSAVTVNPKTGPPTAKIITSGTGFAAHEAVDVYFDIADLALATTNGSGSFTGIRLAVPASAIPGTHWITAVGRRSGLAAQTRFIVQTDWAMFRRGPLHHGDNPTENVLSASTVGGMQLLWSQTICASSELAVANGVVYAGGDAFHATTGKLLWSAPTVSCVCVGCSSTAVSGGVAYVNTFDATIQALDVRNGQQLWISADLGFGFTSTLSNGVIYVGQISGGTFALDAATGAVLWNAYTGNGVEQAPALAGGVVYAESYDWNLYALDAGTGAQLWKTYLGNMLSSPAVANGVVYAGTRSDNLYALNAANGQILWTATTGGWVTSSPAVVDGVVYVGSVDDKFYAFNADTGQVLWSTATGGAIYSSPAVANGVVYVGSDDSHVYAFDAASGAVLWSAATEYTVDASPVVANGMLFVSAGSVLYAFGLPRVPAPVWPEPATLKPDRSLATSR